MAQEHKRLGELLIDAGVITEEQLDAAIKAQRETGAMLGATLIKMGHLTEKTLLRQLHLQLNLPLVDLNETIADEQALSHVKEEMAKKYSALALEVEGRSALVVAMADPLNVAALEDLRFHTGMFIRPVLASTKDIDDAIERYYHMDASVSEVVDNIISKHGDIAINQLEDEEVSGTEDPAIEAETRPVVQLTNWILHHSVQQRASDIHIEPQDRELVVRFRIDGLLHEIQRLPKWTSGALVSRLKVLARIDIAERRRPQDGRLRIEVEGRRIDMRMSTLPITNGEKVVMRVIDTGRALVALDDLGLREEENLRLRRYLDRPQGMVLVTGPTGSGKSTLLYASLRHIQDVTKNIVTVEDPVEVTIRGINQVHVDEKAKKTFAGALRAILRQDPDVIMVGEVRDTETARIAFRASATGHLVLSTVHTNDAASAVTRLIDLGLEPFMVSSALVGVVSMRLVRTLCTRCKEPYEADASTLNRLGGSLRHEGTVTLHRGTGCMYCHDTGYQGRIGIFEILEIDDALRTLISQGAPDSVIRHAAIEAGMRSIGEDGLLKVMDGLTTLEEVTRVVYLSDQGGKVCPSCQTVLSNEYEFCPSCREFVGKLCTHCSRQITGEWTYCAYCGGSIAVEHESPKPKAVPKERRSRERRRKAA